MRMRLRIINRSVIELALFNQYLLVRLRDQTRVSLFINFPSGQDDETQISPAVEKGKLEDVCLN